MPGKRMPPWDLWTWQPAYDLMEQAEGNRFAERPSDKIAIDVDSVANYLGPKKFFNEIALRTSLPGVATGLAWTPVGGDILFVEVTKMPGQGKLLLTGHLGDVMKESAQAALSIVRSRAAKLGVDPTVFKRQDLHIHIPAGAIPKDGPSAGGITIFVAMTGEISLRGLVLPVGGIKEKVLAAKRAGITCILLPNLNRKDIEEIPISLRADLRFEFIETVDQALSVVLKPPDSEDEASLRLLLRRSTEAIIAPSLS